MLIGFETTVSALIFPGHAAEAADFLQTRSLLFAGETAVVFSWPKRPLFACMSD
jgi:hypothetical protein